MFDAIIDLLKTFDFKAYRDSRDLEDALNSKSVVAGYGLQVDFRVDGRNARSTADKDNPLVTFKVIKNKVEVRIVRNISTLSRMSPKFDSALLRAMKAAAAANSTKSRPEAGASAKVKDTVSAKLAAALSDLGNELSLDAELDHGKETKKFVDLVKSTPCIIFSANQLRYVSSVLKRNNIDVAYHGGVSKATGTGIDTKFSQLAVAVKDVKKYWKEVSADQPKFLGFFDADMNLTVPNSGKVGVMSIEDVEVVCVLNRRDQVWHPVSINGVSYSGYSSTFGKDRSVYK